MINRKTVSNTKIYLDCRKLLDMILDITPNFPRAYKFSVGERMHDIAIRLLSEISAAYINYDRRIRIQHLSDFQSDFEVLKTLIRVAGERRWILGAISHNVFKWIYIRGHFESIAIKRRYQKRSITLRKIGYGKRNGRSRSDHNNKRCGCKSNKVVVEKMDSGS